MPERFNYESGEWHEWAGEEKMGLCFPNRETISVPSAFSVANGSAVFKGPGRGAG